ncbi:hypothetical protein TSAR_007915 [Trichomalopsis sarcophagae]|uniref:Uncharacterized protein n=1 Tax=Trichomalopsis sarcophagae TaxID=543379 RepID=A0A232FMR1_9HYME|nr:hypothetical protein TSAR_007915 [Trichomalopsis sarcophagae]
MQITYDLAIAKIAVQIQLTERNNLQNFNNLFIHFGAFHIQMAYFKAIGKYIDNMDRCHFNRSKRIHPFISLAFSILHFERFVQSEDVQISENVKTYLQNFTKNRSIVPTIDLVELLLIIEKYEEYSDKTLKGEHGKTAQYYMIYINRINHYLMLTASIRTNDFELFKFILPKITNLFFVFNQPNYARWLVAYHNKLCKVHETHPGLEVELDRGSFGIKRTDKPFSRIPIDLTLE